MIKILNRSPNLPLLLPDNMVSNHNPQLVIQATSDLFGKNANIKVNNTDFPFVINDSEYTIIDLTGLSLPVSSYKIYLSVEGVYEVSESFQFDPFWEIFDSLIHVYKNRLQLTSYESLRDIVLKSMDSIGEEDKQYILNNGHRFFDELSSKSNIFNIHKERWSWTGKVNTDLDITNFSQIISKILPVFVFYTYSRNYDSWILGPKWEGVFGDWGPFGFDDPAYLLWKEFFITGNSLKYYGNQKKFFFPTYTYTGWSGLFLGQHTLYREGPHTPITVVLNKGLSYFEEITG